MLELFNYTFFQHALLGSLFASIACGIIGTYIVTRRLVFISGGITHASFGGIGIGLYTGISPILSAAIFAVLSAFGVEWLSKRKDMREDSAIAVFWTFGMAIGIIFSFLSPGFAPDLSAFLFGNILTITMDDIWMLIGLSVLLIVFFCLLPESNHLYCFRQRVCTFATNPRGVFRIRADVFHSPHHRGMSPDDRDCAGHFVAHPSADDRQPLHPQFQANHLAIHRHRLPGMLGRPAPVLSDAGSVGGCHHLFLDSGLCALQNGKKHLSLHPYTLIIYYGN